MTMTNKLKWKEEKATPILDDEDMYSDFKEVRQRWLQRQPEWDAIDNTQWDDLDKDAQDRYFAERREQVEIRTMAKWDALSEDSRRMQIESYNNTVDALDKMMHVMYDLERPIPESIRKIACKEFCW